MRLSVGLNPNSSPEEHGGSTARALCIQTLGTVQRGIALLRNDTCPITLLICAGLEICGEMNVSNVYTLFKVRIATIVGRCLLQSLSVWDA